MAFNLWSSYTENLEQVVNLSAIDKNFKPLLACLEELTALTVKEEFRSSISSEVLEILVRILHEPIINSRVLIECVRILRNCSGNNWSSCPELWNKLLNQTIQLLKNYLIKNSAEEEDVILARVTLQCLGNTLNSQPHVASDIWNNFQNNFGDLLGNSDEKISLYSSAAMFGLLRNSPAIMEEVTTDNWKQITSALISSSHQGVLFSQLAIQLYINNQILLEKLYMVHDLDARLLLLHQISDFLPDCQSDARIWKFFSNLFQERASIILRTCENPAIDLEAVEVSGLVEILAKNSSDEVCNKELFHDEELLVATIDLLRSIHSLGKSGSNYFTKIDDHFGAVEPHPALNFKCNLVRLLGNLCYQNLGAQDRARELEAIAPLLECCNLDARNPFIQQWSVLAIRNLCENNPLNQDVISSMTRRGVVQPTVLENLGLQIQESDTGLTVCRSDQSFNKP